MAQEAGTDGKPRDRESDPWLARRATKSVEAVKPGLFRGGVALIQYGPGLRGDGLGDDGGGHRGMTNLGGAVGAKHLSSGRHIKRGVS